MKQLLLFIILSTISVFAVAQAELSGYVTDKENKSPLPGVNVYVPELSKGCITDENGFYKLTQLPEGHFHVQYSFIGYSTEVKHLNFSKSPTNLNIELDYIIIQSQEVVVSGGSYRSQHENAIKIETITPHELDQINSISFIGSLSSIPGVDLISKGPGVSTPVIRGLSLSNILVLNNGIRLENFQFSENHPFVVDEFGIDKVEIIKGPASLLYGSDAIGGVINVIPEGNAMDGKIAGDINLVYHSNTDGWNGNVGFKSTKNGLFYGIRAGVKSHMDYIDGSGTQVLNSRFNEASAKLNVGINKLFGKTALFYNYNRMKLGMTIDPVLPLINENLRENEYWFQDLTNHLIIWKNTAFINQFKLNLNVSYQLNTRKLTESINPLHNEVHMQLNTLFYELKVYFPTNEKMDIIMGFQGTNSQNKNDEAPVHVLPDYSRNDFSFYGLYQHDMTKKIHFQAGLRYDLRNIYVPEQEKTSHSHEEGQVEPEEFMPELTNDYSNLSASLGATFEFGKHWLLRTNYASAYRTPTVAELTQDGMHGNRYEQGDRNLNSQRSHEIDLSIHLHSKVVTFDVAGFYNRVNSYIYLTPTEDTTDHGEDIYRYVQDDAQLYGIETGISLKTLEVFQFKLSYAYLLGEKLDGSALPFIPQNKVNGSILFDVKDLGFIKAVHLTPSFTYAFKQDRPALFESSTDDYFILSAMLGLTIPVFNEDVLIGFNAHNLLDTKYYDHLSTLKGMGYYNMGRNFSISLKVPFNSGK